MQKTAAGGFLSFVVYDTASKIIPSIFLVKWLAISRPIVEGYAFISKENFRALLELASISYILETPRIIYIVLSLSKKMNSSNKDTLLNCSKNIMFWHSSKVCVFFHIYPSITQGSMYACMHCPKENGTNL